MKIALLIATILLAISCRKPQAVFQKSKVEPTIELPQRFKFKTNLFKIKSKGITLDSTINSNSQILSQKIDNERFTNRFEFKKAVEFVNKNPSKQEVISIQKIENQAFISLPFALALGATLLFAIAVSINFLILGGGVSSIFWTINSFLGLAGVKQKSLLSENQNRMIRVGFTVGFLALLMVLITSLVLAV